MLLCIALHCVVEKSKNEMISIDHGCVTKILVEYKILSVLY